MKTELVWDDKYDEYGARRPVDIAGYAMPMQKIETVDMPRSVAWPGGIRGMPSQNFGFFRKLFGVNDG
jgi:hypothetical protein